MSYDFDTIKDRSGTYSIKWNISDGELPMWVADMDFETAPEIKQAIVERAGHGIFGYSYVPDEWYDAYTKWWNRRYDYGMDRDSLLFCTGIVPAISATIRSLTEAGDKIILMTPVYNYFFYSVRSNGRVPVECPLINEGDHFEIEWEGLEKACADPHTSLILFCNPHNPTGTGWSKNELEKVGEICKRNGVTVISDEIHCDLTAPDYKYIPFAGVNDINKEICITCIAPSKTFNLAGVSSAAVSISDKTLREKVGKSINISGIADPNAFAIQAAVNAYNLGEPWLEELRDYIFENKKYIRGFIDRHIPELKDVSGPCTYLSWIDARGLGEKAVGFAKKLRRDTGLWIIDGKAYGKAGEGYLRINAASPRSIVEDGMNRLKRGVEIQRSGK